MLAKSVVSSIQNLAGICILVHAMPAALANSQADFFETRIRPVLATHCYGCHGPEKQKSGLRLDHISYLKSGGETGPVLAAGDLANSRLALAVSYSDVSLQMPPSGKLPENQIADIRQWIADGAYWPDEPAPQDVTHPKPVFDVQTLKQQHWAWQPILPVALPSVQNSAWPINDIDRFILARLEHEGLSPAPEADRRTLIRRLSFDLTGLPPEPGAVDAFVNDTRPDAYERVVDGLLASLSFGERWGRHWLDVTRYAETYGHEQDFPIEYAWRYRDYVIRAFNADVPYDRLVREHIAGDLLPDPRLDPATGINESILATGFWFMHQATHAPVDVRLDQTDRIDNQIDVFSKAFLGMTVSCARCHDHKFDAISAKDYYALSGFLRSSRQQHAYLDPHGQIESKVKQIENANLAAEPWVREALARSLAAKDTLSSLLTAASESRKSGLGLSIQAARLGVDAASLVRAARVLEAEACGDPAHPLHLWWKMSRVANVDESFFRDAFNNERTHARLDAASTDRVFETFDSPVSFKRWFVYGSAFGESPSAQGAWEENAGHISLAPSGAAHSGLIDSRLEGAMRSQDFVIDRDCIQYRAAGWGGYIRIVIEGYELRKFSNLLFESTYLPVSHGEPFRWLHQIDGLSKFKGRTAYIEIVDPGEGWIAVDEIRFGDTIPEADGTHPVLRALLNPVPPRSMGELADRYATIAANAMQDWLDGTASRSQVDFVNILMELGLLTPFDGEPNIAGFVASKRALAGEVPQYTRALAIGEGTPQEESLMLRGSYKTTGESINRRFLEAIAGLDQPPCGEGSGRLTLADQLLADSNPLPARVMANRIWHHLMGRGIVPSTDNFGVLGQTPSHPELLDYLAIRFRENGWSIKQLIRDVVTSRAYRMSSDPVYMAAEDKDPDNVLLHRMNRRRLEGEAVRDAILAVAGTLDNSQFGPSIPAYISPYVEGNRRPKESGPADGARRRSIYLEIRRNYLPPMLQAFDMPVPDTTQGRRNVSNVPAQALMLMNDPFVVEQAAAWAKEIVEFVDDTDERIRLAYVKALSRNPTDQELARTRTFADQQAVVYGNGGLQADVRVWTDICHVLFTLKEFIFIG
ncbi:MAG: hypothetical protein AMXMBFR84_23850 [Candidatus Hydrogenedentota bacterium]